jgi:hypothetical protein
MSCRKEERRRPAPRGHTAVAPPSQGDCCAIARGQGAAATLRFAPPGDRKRSPRGDCAPSARQLATVTFCCAARPISAALRSKRSRLQSARAGRAGQCSRSAPWRVATARGGSTSRRAPGPGGANSGLTCRAADPLVSPSDSAWVTENGGAAPRPSKSTGRWRSAPSRALRDARRGTTERPRR